LIDEEREKEKLLTIITNGSKISMIRGGRIGE
jgi:hypothetical protein